MVGIGSTVWLFNINRRVYRERKPGEIYASGAPIWREHWVPHLIVGETARSWVLEYGRKVPKKGADPRCVSFSSEEINRAAYVHENAPKIGDKVRRIADADLLRKVADLIGYSDA